MDAWGRRETKPGDVRREKEDTALRRGHALSKNMMRSEKPVMPMPLIGLARVRASI